MTTVRIDGLEKSFGNVEVLKGVDLFVPDGSVVAVLGPSGSGKTTLLRVLAGFEHANGGRISFDDEIIADDVHHVRPEHRRIGFVPQDGSLFPHLNVAENVGFGLKRSKTRSTRIAEVLDLVGLADLSARHPHELSGGQQQRVALGRALAPMPRLVLLDEPFSSLDARLRSELREDVISVLRAADTTSVLVTHDQDEALSLADEVALLRDGRVAQCARPSELYTNPADPVIASFVGVANFVTGRLEDGVVVTPFGPLPLRTSVPLASTKGEVIALIRPEDLAISERESGRGIAASVERIEYYGHDALVHLVVRHEDDAAISVVFPNPSGVYGAERRAKGAVVVRIHGATAIKEGDTVRVGATGPVLAWPGARL